MANREKYAHQLFGDHIDKFFDHVAEKIDLSKDVQKQAWSSLYHFWLDDNFTYDDWKWEQVKFYLHKVVEHKIAVFDSGIDILHLAERFKIPKGIFIRNLILHDLSKFGTVEAPAYAFYDFKSGKDHPLAGFSFEYAWHHHKHNNPHHPEYWFSVGKSGEAELMTMPKIYILEMVADWMGAGKTYGNSLEDWLPDNINRFEFATPTARVLNEMLTSLNLPANCFYQKTSHKIT